MEVVGWRKSDLNLIPDLRDLRSGFFESYWVPRSLVAMRVGSSPGIWGSVRMQ